MYCVHVSQRLFILFSATSSCALFIKPVSVCIYLPICKQCGSMKQHGLESETDHRIHCMALSYPGLLILCVCGIFYGLSPMCFQLTAV